MNIKILLILLLFILNNNLIAQDYNTYKKLNSDTILSFQLDSDIVVFANDGLSEQDFIDEILQDTVFYEGFRKSKRHPYDAVNKIKTYNKKGKQTASIYREIQHKVESGRYTNKIVKNIDSGDIYKKNGEYELFTVKMFDYIFDNNKNLDYTEKLQDVNNTPTKNESESYKQKLKTLIFSPGKPIKGIPLISSKTEIFSDDMKKFYDYEFISGVYMDSIPVYRFKCTVKPEYANSDRIMIRELTTTFDKYTFQILARYIDMSYSNMAFDFDVRMNIEMNYFDGELLPVNVNFDGNWDIPFNKREIVKFDIYQYNYK